MPWVRIVADYCSRGYQLADAAARACIDLPIDPDLTDRLAAWTDDYERHCRPTDYEDISGMRFDFVAFAARGLALARAVKRQLPSWRVTYFDEALDWYLARDPRCYDPARAEYEVTLADALREADALSEADTGAAAGGRGEPWSNVPGG